MDSLTVEGQYRQRGINHLGLGNPLLNPWDLLLRGWLYVTSYMDLAAAEETALAAWRDTAAAITLDNAPPLGPPSAQTS